jgi:hypothetical protein
MPPPFPFTVFVIASSALQISRRRVLTAVGAGRFVRFVVLSLLASKFGTQIIRVSERDEVQYFVIVLAVVAMIGSALSVAKWLRSVTSRPRQPAPGRPAKAQA